MSYRIGSFNLRNLSFATRDKTNPDLQSTKRDYSTIGRIISNNFDIVALQEVQTENVLQLIFKSTTKWSYRWSQSFSKSDDSKEGYAFAWNKEKLQLVSEPVIWKQYKVDPLLGHRGLLRQPYYGRFTPVGTISGGPFFEIRILNTHIRFDPKASTEAQIGKIEARRREFKVLVDSILNKLDVKRYGDNKPAYTFLMGDYNLELKRPDRNGPFIDDFVVVMDQNHQKKYITTQDQLTTLSRKVEKVGNNNITSYGDFSHNYDHFTYDECAMQRSGIKLKIQTIDTVTRYRNGDFERHFLEISDHIPIVLTLNLK